MNTPYIPSPKGRGFTAIWVRFELIISHSQSECSTKLSYAKIDIIWSCREDLNLQPTDYKSVALPIELRQHNGGQEEIRTLGRF